MSLTQTMHLSSLKYICRCCHSDGKFYSLKEPYKFRGQVEVYYRMLIETFGILISPPTIEASYTICNDCIIRLRDATTFRKQVEDCEEKFNKYSQLLLEPVQNNDDFETMAEFKNKSFKKIDNEIVNVDFDENVGDEFRKEIITATNLADGLSNGDEVQDLDVVEDSKLVTVEYRLGNVNETKDIYENVMENQDDLNKAENSVDPLLKHSTGIRNKNMFGCVFCSKKFSSKDLLKIHMKEHRNKKYKCNECGHSCLYLTRLKKHSKTVHNKLINLDEDVNTDKKDKNPIQNAKLPNYLKCRFCKKQVREYYYERHLKIHVGKTECINCGEIFDSTDLLKEHSKKHKYENMYTCDFCKKRFIARSTLKRHIDLHHMGKDRKFMCHECGVFFNDITNLRAHTTTVHLKLRIFECSVCQKKLATKKTLKVHMRTHTGERPYVCDECGDGFTCFTRLKIHKIKHDIMKKYGTKYVCKICHTTFHGQGILTHHVRSEHPECFPITINKYKRKYLPCPSCNKVFSQKFSLDRHMTKHGIIDKVSCELCNKMLTDKCSLDRHLRNIHTSKEKVIKEKVQCSLCKRKVQDIENHMTVHTVRPMKCETCGKSYPDTAILHRHVMNVHHDLNKIFQCKKCDHRPYSRRESLRSHMLKKHGCDLKAE